jgi:PPM family protein phosphatase
VYIKCKTDVGKVRDINEDYVLSLKGDKYWLLIVADGMGGHNAGEIASRMASTTIRRFVYENFKGYIDKEELIRDAIVKSNFEVFDESAKHDNYKGMGTTITCCLIFEQKLYLGHVGDSRAYIVSQDGIRKITEDHSFVQELIKNGSITENEAFSHPKRNLITRAIGTEKYVIVDTKVIDIDYSDIIVMCTDGLTSYISDEELCEIILDMKENGVEKLVDLAIDRGGRDNISIMIARKGEKDE